MNSLIAGIKESKTIATIISVRLFFTSGMLPKKYPANVSELIHATLPNTLNITNIG